jgi:hypothetical protein
MSAVGRQLDNLNFLSPLGFRFLLAKAPGVEYFAQSANIPSIATSSPPIHTPFVKLPMAGDHLDFGDFNLTFKIDENMVNYLEIYNWLVGITFPDRFDQYRAIANTSNRDGVYSDATLVVLTNSKNANIEIRFKNMIPISLSDVMFDTTQMDVTYVSATVTFKYQSFDVVRLTS